MPAEDARFLNRLNDPARHSSESVGARAEAGSRPESAASARAKGDGDVGSPLTNALVAILCLPGVIAIGLLFWIAA